MSNPEPDDTFRARLNRVVDEGERDALMVAVGWKLDEIGRRYDRFRTGVPLRGADGLRDRNAERFLGPH